MVETMNTYWNENGKYQQEGEKLGDLVPNWGMTDNKYLNLYIIASSIYYDVYNNGGGNLHDNYTKKIEEYLVPFADDLTSMRLNLTKNTSMNTVIKNINNKGKLEAFLDEIIMYLQDKDLKYDKHRVFFNNEKEELSKEQKEGFHEITFGTEKEYTDWVNFRLNLQNFKFVE